MSTFPIFQLNRIYFCLFDPTYMVNTHIFWIGRLHCDCWFTMKSFRLHALANISLMTSVWHQIRKSSDLKGWVRMTSLIFMYKIRLEFPITNSNEIAQAVLSSSQITEELSWLYYNASEFNIFNYHLFTFSTHLHAALFSFCFCPGYLNCHGGTDRGSRPDSGYIPFSGYSCLPLLKSCCLSVTIIPVPFPLSLPSSCWHSSCFICHFFILHCNEHPAPALLFLASTLCILSSTKQSLKSPVTSKAAINSWAMPEIVLLMRVKDDLGEWSRSIEVVLKYWMQH